MPPLPIESQPDLAPIVNAAATISTATTRPTIAEPCAACANHSAAQSRVPGDWLPAPRSQTPPYACSPPKT